MKTMYDSIEAVDLPLGGDFYLGYINGKFANFVDVVKRFGPEKTMSCSVFASTPAQILDVENGDATPAQAPQWYYISKSSFQRPTIYCNRDTKIYVVTAFQASGFLPDFIIATLDDVMPGPLFWSSPENIGCQWSGRGDYDETLINDPSWPSIPSIIAPPPSESGGYMYTPFTASLDSAGNGWIETTANQNNLVNVLIFNQDPTKPTNTPGVTIGYPFKAPAWSLSENPPPLGNKIIFNGGTPNIRSFGGAIITSAAS